MTGLLALVAVVGCGTGSEERSADVDPAAPAAPSPDAPVPAEPEADEASEDAVYVLASSLNLRETPDRSGEKLGTLTVNSPLEILEEKTVDGDAWVRVRVRNGTEGWVVRSFLADAPLTAEVARENAETAALKGEKDEAVSWWQRAAAIDDAPAMLEGLATAYEAAGQTAAAARVRSQLQWPATTLFLRPGWSEREDEILAYWRVAWDVGPEGDIPRSQWASMGLDVEESWWLLPPEGPAVQTEVVGFQRGIHNECAGDEWVSVTLKVPASLQSDHPDEWPVLAHRGDPPKSWTTAIPGSRPTRASAEALVKEDAQATRGASDDVQVRLTPTESGWTGSVFWPTGEYNELGGAILNVASVEVGQDVVLGKVEQTAEVVPLSAVRDVTGDGEVEQVYTSACESYVLDADGQRRASTPFGCCGC